MKASISKIEEYNCWTANKLYDAGLIRDDYLNKLNSFIGNKLIKVLVGQRRSGKSYILRQIINHLITNHNINRKNTFYLNKEYLAFSEIESSTDLDLLFSDYLEEIKPKGKIYIFLDEVQNISEWEKFVNSYAQDFNREYEIYITGSNSELLSGELATLLSGRYIEFLIFPFNLNEYANANNTEVSQQLFIQYLQFGGLPEMLSLKNADMKRHYIESLKDTIILRDIIERKGVKDVVLLEEIFRFIIANTGNLTSFNSIVKYFKSKQKKTNYETLSSYIKFLTQTFIIHQAERYNLKGKQVLGGERKLYLNDLSYKTYFQGFLPSDIGYYIENFVYLQLRQIGLQVFVGNWDKYEIDFVAIMQNKTIYVQVAYLLANKETIDREFGNLLKIKDNHPKIVVSMDDFKFDNPNGILHIKPWELRSHLEQLIS